LLIGCVTEPGRWSGTGNFEQEINFAIDNNGIVLSFVLVMSEDRFNLFVVQNLRCLNFGHDFY